MPDELRTQGAAAFFADESLKDFHRAAETFIARHKNFRPAFIRKLPLEKRVFYLAHLPLTPDLASQLLVSYHFAQQRPLMTAFLDALGIPNDNGLITGEGEVGPPDEATLKAAVAAVKEKFPAEDVQRYFATLYAQNPEAWAGLKAAFSR